jgi:hypothetical protein
MAFVKPNWITTEPQSHAIFETLVDFLSDASGQGSSCTANMQDLASSTLKNLCSICAKDPFIDFEPHYLDSNMNEGPSNLKSVLVDFSDDVPLHSRLEYRPYYCLLLQRLVRRRQPDEYLTGREWEGINCFIARLLFAAPDMLKVDLHGLYAIVDALEQPLTSAHLDNILPVAVVWIMYARNELHNNDVPYAYHPSHGSSKRLPWSKGELWIGPRTFNQARRHFWMQRFKGIDESEDVSDVVQKAARQAFESGSRLDSLGVQMTISP